MEKLLHYVWMHRLLPSHGLQTTDGRSIEVLDPGQYNNNQGPDFSNARIRLDDMMWAGNVEIHTVSGDWSRHGHDKDAVYNTTILHVVESADTEVRTQNGNVVPQLVVVATDVQCDFVSGFTVAENLIRNAANSYAMVALSNRSKIFFRVLTRVVDKFIHNMNPFIIKILMFLLCKKC